MNCGLICCFFARHSKVERILRCFLNQDYIGETTLLLYNNSKIPQDLDRIPLPDNKHIILINNHLDLKTEKEYTNTGDVFRDALTFVPEECEIINWFDSDDIFLPNHVSEGVKRMKIALKNDYLAYKPYFSYYLYGDNQVKKDHNNFEPSIFCLKSHIQKEGFHSVACSYHSKWMDRLNIDGQMYNPYWAQPTFCYCWEQGHGTHKISGAGDSAENFKAHRMTEQDNGDGVLSPAKEEIVQKYYDLVKNQ